MRRRHNPPSNEPQHRLIDALYKWKYVARFETNNPKFHLMVHRPIKHVVQGRTTYTSSHEKDASVQLPGHAKITLSESSATLLGCQLRTAPSEDHVWKHYTKHVVPHQLTVQRVLHQVGCDAALEYERAVVKNPLLQAAAADMDAMSYPKCIDKLQRALWCGGDTTALGVSGYAN